MDTLSRPLKRRRNPGRSRHDDVGRLRYVPLQSSLKTLHLYTSDNKGPVLRQGANNVRVLPYEDIGKSRTSSTHWVTLKRQTTLRKSQRYSDECNHSRKYMHLLEKTSDLVSSSVIRIASDVEKMSRKGTLRLEETLGPIRVGSTGNRKKKTRNP